MKDYNVYMIDDGETKQACFLQILDHVNKLAPDYGFRNGFSEGFGRDPVEARKLALTPERLWKALEDEKGIYLVDLELIAASGEDLNVEGFLDAFDSTTDPLFSDISKCYKELLYANATKPVVLKALERFVVAVHILLYCRAKNKPTLLVSIQPGGGLIPAIKDLNLATLAGEQFPSWDPNEYPISSQEIERWAQLILSLPNPLDRVKSQTSNWFSEKFDGGWRSLEEDGLPHNTDGWTKVTIEQHRDFVRGVFPHFPDKWWENKVKADALHQCLKTIVGAHAQWMGNYGDHYLSLGGAYLLFLLALWQKFPEQSEQFLVSDWTCFCTLISERGKKNSKMEPLPFLGNQQDQEVANWSVRSLYDFFVNIVTLEDGVTLGISNFSPPTKDKPYFSLKLLWSPENFQKFAGGIQSKIGDAFRGKDHVKFPKGKSVTSLLRFLVASQIRDSGFGAKGTIRLEDDDNEPIYKRRLLIIGQFDALP